MAITEKGNMKDFPRPITLLILDGFGHRQDKDSNAILSARTPNIDRLWQDCPHTLLSGSGRDVGLPGGQMGNSEVGHLNLGAGRIVHQDFSRIEQSIEQGYFFTNSALVTAMEQAKSKGGAVHVMGLLSAGGVHSHEHHFQAMVELAAKQGVDKLYFHLFLDGRDTPPKSAQSSIEKLEDIFNRYQLGQVVSLIGRYYAMDRDQRWERIEQAYNLLTEAKANRHAASAVAGLQMAYDDGETDEFVTATSIHHQDDKQTVVSGGDALIFLNYRADRARQITRAFIEVDFSGFMRQCWPKLATFVSMTQYDANFKVATAFPPFHLNNCLGEVIARNHMKQLRIAETEKYAHVTFFFNGGVEDPFTGEERVLIPSPKVATYDLKPEMSAVELTDRLLEAIASGQYDFIVCNYANADMVGHSGSFDAAVKAVECLDDCIGRVSSAINQVSGELMITADHGNAEKMYNRQTKQPHTAHTTEPVPFIYQGRQVKMIKQQGTLRDVAPTMLYLAGIEPPQEMTGEILLQLDD